VISTDEIANRLIAWARDILPDLQGGYPYPEGDRDQPLPDVGCVVNSGELVRSHPDFPQLTIQQALVQIRRCDLLLVAPPEPIDEWTPKLYGWVDTIEQNILDDYTLGDRLEAVSPFVSHSNRPPFVQFEDGSTGRMTTVSMVVAQSVPVT
jgi:hypothetical protein